MAEEKSKKTDQKVFDVARPGKSAPDATAKPIIITNRPVLRDPMVVKIKTTDDDEDDTTSGSPALITPSEVRHRVQINPMHTETSGEVAPGAPEVKNADIKKETDNSKVEDETLQKLDIALPAEVTGDAVSVPPLPDPALDLSKPADEKSDEAGSKDESLEASSETTTTNPTESEADTNTAPAPESTTEDTTKPTEKTSDVAESTAPEEPEATPTEETKEASDDQLSQEAGPSEGDSSTIPGANDKADQAAKKKAEEQEKIIESGEYYLPINAVGHRKAVHHIALGILLMIVLAALLLLVALDAGFLTIPGFPAPTNFL